ncbi:MAG TPA: DVUA0089 family protein [Geminicoccaceae bacterium]|nr:DVUA0089 family protein [Geminicoccaceae bacterium]
MVVVVKSRKATLIAAAFAASLIQGTPQAQALDLTLGGALDDPNDVFLIEFSVAGPGPSMPVTLFTSTFDPINGLLDGVDPYLTLFSGTGDFALLEAEDDDGAAGFSATVDGVIFTGGDLDSLLALDLPAGDYTLGLSSFPNFAEGPLLGDGYVNFGFETGTFRVHLLGIDQVLGTQGPAPASPSFPRRDFIS